MSSLTTVSDWRRLGPGLTYTRYDGNGNHLGRYCYQGIDTAGDLLWVNEAREQSRMDPLQFDHYYHCPG